MIKSLSYISMFLFATMMWSQDASQVTTQVDRDSIMMGEEIKLSLSVPFTSSDLVIFPVQQSLGAMEVIESYPVDTIRDNDRMTLFKQYGITQFDSGDYYIPRLKILKNNQSIYSDSLLVKVREVKTDTAVQKMFPIKGDIANDYKRPFNWMGLWLLLLWIPLGILFWWLSRKRTLKTYEQTLPPYEWSKYRLNKLAESSLVTDRAWKEYYTELSYIVRRYIDNKVYGHAMESTTAQLIENIEKETAAKGVSITDKTKTRLQAVLQKADLIKFAGIPGDGISARDDREAIHDIIYNIHQVLPPPSEEELLLDVAYRKEQARKLKTRKILTYVIGIILGLAIAIAAWIVIAGVDNVKDQLLGNELREYYEADQFTSSYGAPGLTVATPEILERDLDYATAALPPEAAAALNVFDMGALEDDFYLLLATLQLDEDAVKNAAQINTTIIVAPFIQKLEGIGATNIVTLDEEIERNGIKGTRFTGSYDLNGITYEYETLSFLNNNAIQAITISTAVKNVDNNDNDYGKLLKQRIIESINLKSPQPDKQEEQ